MTSSQHEHQRKLVAGACMIGSPLFGVAAWAVAPAMDSDEGAALREIAGATGRATASAIFGTISVALGVFAVLGVVHLLRDRESRLGQIGGAVAVLGLVGVMMNTGIQAAAIEIAKRGSDGASAALYDDILTGTLGFVGIASGVLLSAGLLMLCVALFQAEAAPQPSTVLIGLFAIGQVAGFLLFSNPIVLASFLALAIGLVPLGYLVLTETDDQWEHTPRFHGFHWVATQ